MSLEMNEDPKVNDEPRILIVDDDEIMRTLLGDVLAEAGYAVETVEDGGQAVKRFSLQPAQLLIVDIFMPRKDGIETIQELKSQYPALKIIAISSGGLTSEMEFLDHAQFFGADQTFSKPLDFDKMLEAVRELVGPGQSSL
jgi:CheY-like chemotaxis protein